MRPAPLARPLSSPTQRARVVAESSGAKLAALDAAYYTHSQRSSFACTQRRPHLARRLAGVFKIASASLFSYISSILPAIVIGNILDDQTDGQLGLPEASTTSSSPRAARCATAEQRF